MHYFLNTKNLSERVLVLGIFSILALAAIAFAEEPETKEPFYKNVSATIEMRLMLESDDEDTPWLYMQDLEGISHKVSKEIFIDSSDVGGVTLKEKVLVMHFHPNSWENVREVTARYLKNQMAIIKDGQILFVGKIHEPIIKAAVLSDNPKDEDLPWLLKGFTRSASPSYLNSIEQDRIFLEKWVTNHPDSLAEKESLASLYLKSNDPQQIELGLPLFEELASIKTTDEFIHEGLVRSYAKLTRFDQALSAAQRAIPNISDLGKFELYRMVGEIYYFNGDREEALANLQLRLNIFREFFNKEKTKSLLKFSKNSITSNKNKVIKSMKDRIELYSNALSFWLFPSKCLLPFELPYLD